MSISNASCSLIQAAWMATCLSEAMAFRRAANNQTAIIQGGVLKWILQGAAATEYGRLHHFARIRNVEEYRQSIPVNDYDDLQPWIDRIVNCAEQVLTADRVQMFEETSGTSGGTRLIPYTASLQVAFNRALHPWLFDLHTRFRGIWGGPAYWAVSPRGGGSRQTPGGIPIGFAADSDYFGKWAKPLIRAMTIVSEEVAGMADPLAWRYVTVLSLLRNADMRLISLWNPTLFTSLIKVIEEWADLLAEDLAAGTCRPGFLQAESLAGLESFGAKPLPQRAGLIKEALKHLSSGNNAGFARILWPRAALVSCWSEAEAARGADYLRSFFPDAHFQTKGLLATEGPVTLPMTGAVAPVLAVRSAFFEFEEGEEGSGQIRLASELENGCRYRVIMTTAGGLYRYRLHDIVEMRGWWRNLPCLAFCGKENMVSDLCGEKLNSAQVKRVLSDLFGPDSSVFLAPEKPELPQPPFYSVFISCDEIKTEPAVAARKIESAFSDNLHYRWCREAGQLGPVQVCVLRVNRAEITDLCLQRLSELGRTISTAKLGVLNKTSGWKSWFEKKRIL